MRLIAAAAGLALAGCAPVGSPPVADGPDACGAAAARSLIGTHVGAVSFPAEANVRVVCTTCPTTRDFRPDRLNVRFEQSTGIVRSVDCG